MYWDGGPEEQKRIELSLSPPVPHNFRGVQQMLLDRIGIDRCSNYWDAEMNASLEWMFIGSR